MSGGLRLLLLSALLVFGCAANAKEKLNILFLTVDDMSCDSIGAFGCDVPGTSPNIDKLASQGVQFNLAHTQVGNCMPSRNVMQSGRYPHNNGVEGFYQVKDPDYPILPDLLRDNGYFIGIKGKVSHSTPYHPYDWDIVLEPDLRKNQRDKDSFYDLTRKGIAAAKSAGKPFYLVMNINDPHKPFYGMDNKQNLIDDPLKPSRIFETDEVVVPGFLPDTPGVRLELAHYYSSVRRADDCAGAVLKALEDSGEAENTLIMFLSDHGMALPFAKTAVWHHSTHTPWLVRWPGVVESGRVDDEHMISAVDFAPTILEVLGIPEPKGMDGHSFLPVLKTGKQAGRDYIIKEYNENSGGNRSPMRAIQGRKYSYIFNPWSDGERVFKTATTGTIAYKEMQRLAAIDPGAAERLRLFDYRDPEELYDYENDPDALDNLINNPEVKNELNRLRKEMENWMVRTGDPLLPVLRNRENKAFKDAYIEKVQKESDDRRASQRKSRPNVQKRDDLIEMRLPKSASAGNSVTVQIAYTVPKQLGTQKIHVTIKDGAGKRIDRKIVEVKGNGTARIEFSVPQMVANDSVQFAAFIGKDYDVNLQHLNSIKVKVK